MSTMTIDQIKEHMEVVDSQGKFVGKVDHVMGDQIKLTKNDDPQHEHHIIPVTVVQSVDEKVHLSQSIDQIRSTWQTA